MNPQGPDHPPDRRAAGGGRGRAKATPLVVPVHSPSVGPATWQPVATELRARGRDVIVPSLLVCSVFVDAAILRLTAA